VAEYVYLDPDGVIVVDTLDTLAEVQQEFKDAQGDQDLTVDVGPLSVLINSIAESRDNVAKSAAQIANQFNPNVAGGVMLDAICAFSDTARDGAERTRVTCQVTGTPGVVLPLGSSAATNPTITGDQYFFESEIDVAFDGSGNAEVDFLCTIDGAIIVPSASLTSIADGVIGWFTVTNSSAGTPGKLAQSDSSTRIARINELEGQGRSLSGAVTGSVYSVEGVESVGFYNNIDGSPVVIDGATIPANRMYISVFGGSDADVGAALLGKVTGGSGFTASDMGTAVNETIEDPYSLKDYDIEFGRPDTVEIEVQLTIKPNASFSNPETVAKDAVVAYGAGLIDGYSGSQINVDSDPFEISEAVNEYSSSINCRKCEVRLNGGVFSTDSEPMTIFEIPIYAAVNVTVVQI